MFLAFPKPLCSHKQKNKHYNTNILNKQKIAMETLYENPSFSTWLRVVKALYRYHFCKTVFKIKLVSKKFFKAFVKLNPNNTQTNIYLLTYLVKCNSNENFSALKPNTTKKKIFFTDSSLLLGLWKQKLPLPLIYSLLNTRAFIYKFCSFWKLDFDFI